MFRMSNILVLSLAVVNGGKEEFQCMASVRLNLEFSPDILMNIKSFFVTKRETTSGDGTLA